MAKKKVEPKNYNVGLMHPDELGALKALVKEFIGKIEAVDNEIELLKGDRVEIIEEYSDKLDMKTLQAALKVVKIQSSVAHRDTFDLFVESLSDHTLGDTMAKNSKTKAKKAKKVAAEPSREERMESAVKKVAKKKEKAVTAKVKVAKTFELHLTKFELLHLRDLLSVAFPPEGRVTVSQALAKLENRPLIESYLWNKVSDACISADLPMDSSAPDYVVAPSGAPPLGVFQLAQEEASDSSDDDASSIFEDEEDDLEGLDELDELEEDDEEEEEDEEGDLHGLESRTDRIRGLAKEDDRVPAALRRGDHKENFGRNEDRLHLGVWR